jgi:hypothetical protein
MQETADRQTLRTDLARTNISADVSSTYGRLRDMTVAWPPASTTLLLLAAWITGSAGRTVA